MTVEQAMDALATAIAVLFLWVFTQWFYRAYRVERFRQELFCLRSDLFDWAACENIPFTHPAYTLIRSTLNGTIRFGDRINVWGMLAVAWTFRRHDVVRSFPTLLREAKCDLPSEQQQFLDVLVKKMHKAVAKQVVLGSPFLLMILIPGILLLIAHFVSTKAVEAVLRKVYPAALSFAIDDFALTATTIPMRSAAAA